MSLPTSIEAPRHRSAAERLAAKLGGEHRFRQLMAAFVNALEAGGPVRIEAHAAKGEEPLEHAPMVYNGTRAW